jgi:hypothetical protein
MKAIIISLLVVCGLVSQLQAGAWEDTIRGGLIGAAGGALIAELTDEDARITVPLFSSIGALTGYAIHENRRYPHRYRHHSYYLPYLALPYAHYPYSYRSYHRYQEPVRTTHTKKSDAGVQVQQPINRHPGVERVSVPITLRNGTVVPIRLFKRENGYTGPRGEFYETLPDAATLAQQYIQ